MICNACVVSALQMLNFDRGLLQKLFHFLDPFSQQPYLPLKFGFGLRHMLSIPFYAGFVHQANT